MTSIINFEENMKSTDRTSDIIFSSLNRFHEAKLNGALEKDELSKIIVLTGNVFANKIKQGKVSDEEIDQVESFVEGLSSHYFNHEHTDLERASKIFLEGNYAALEKSNTRVLNAQPVLSASDYESGFIKLR